MKLIKIVFSLTFILLISNVVSQNETDVIRYSTQTLGSSARAYGLGGAIGAIGADFSSAVVNPSGMARFRKSYFYVTGAFNSVRNETNYIDNLNSDKKFNAHLPNIGFIVNVPLADFNSKNPKGLVNVVFGFNASRTSNFNRLSTFSGANNSSVSQNWAERGDANNDVPANFSMYSLEYLAFQSWMIDADRSSSTPKYISAYGNSPINVRQRGVIQNSGRMADYSGFLALNLQHIVFLGLTLGAKSIDFTETNNFTETDLKTGSVNDVSSVSMNQTLKTSGIGFNAKFGLTICPTEKIRLGYAFHAPTFFNLSDSYSYSISSRFDFGAKNPFGFDRVNTTSSTGDLIYKYKISTPITHVFSLALVDKKIGFLSLDLENVDYTTSRISPKDPTEEPFDTENERVQNLLKKNGLNVKIGGEYIFEEYRFRAGYANYGGVYRNNAVPFSSKLNRKFYSLGAGIVKDRITIDMALVFGRFADFSVPYTINNLSVNQKNFTVTNNIRTTNFVVSVAFKLD